MKKILKSIPLAVLVLPLVAGCGKNGPSFTKKGSLVTGNIFAEAYKAAEENAKWNVEGTKMLGGKIVEKSTSKTKAVHKRGSKVLTKTVSSSKDEGVYKFDASKHIATYDSTYKSETKKKGVGIKKDIKKSKTFEKGGMESYSNLFNGIIYGFASFDHVKKEYSVLASFESAQALDEAFQESIKEEIVDFFSLPNASSFGSISDEEAVNYKFYVNSNIFTVIYEETETLGTDKTNAPFTRTTKKVGKMQLNLTPGKYKMEYFSSMTDTFNFIGAVDLRYGSATISIPTYAREQFANGDTFIYESTSKEVVKGKEKKTNLKATKTSKYKNLSEELDN